MYSSAVEFRYPWGQSSLGYPGRHGICACFYMAGCFVPPVRPAGGSRELAWWVKRLPGYLLRSPWVVQVPLLGAFKGLTATLAVHAHPLPGAPVWLWAEGVLHRPTHTVRWLFPRQTCCQIPTQAQERAGATGATSWVYYTAQAAAHFFLSQGFKSQSIKTLVPVFGAWIMSQRSRWPSCSSICMATSDRCKNRKLELLTIGFVW